jgi:antitoxin component YwqK of YwqJK toxin-antitoxin module
MEFNMSNNQESKPIRVSYDDLEHSDEDDSLLLNGKPFTGILYDEYDNGQAGEEEKYVDGHQVGPFRRWYENGQLREEGVKRRGFAPDKMSRWHENGVLKSTEEREWGVVVSCKEWDEHGKLISEREIEPGSSDHGRLLKWREFMAKQKS